MPYAADQLFPANHLRMPQSCNQRDPANDVASSIGRRSYSDRFIRKSYSWRQETKQQWSGDNVIETG